LGVPEQKGVKNGPVYQCFLKTPCLGTPNLGSKRVDLGYLGQMCTKCTLKNTHFGVFLGVLFLGVLFLGLKNGPFSLQTWFLAPKTRIFGSILPPKPGSLVRGASGNVIWGIITAHKRAL
jgi:hypothetical protein